MSSNTIPVITKIWQQVAELPATPISKAVAMLALQANAVSAPGVPIITADQPLYTLCKQI